jgi:uncharacterized phage protein gp47/JayE
VTTYPLQTLGPTISANGISIPAYSDIYASLQASFQAIYGSTAVISPSSQDGQMLAIFAQAIYDCNLAMVALYNAYSPATAAGTPLSSAVKINALARQAGTYSTAPLTITGQANQTIPAGIAQDLNGYQWALPANTVIPNTGTITVTATCTTIGAIAAAPNTITTIANPTLGWQSVTNATAATVGSNVENDGALRMRQAASTAGPSTTLIASILASVAAVPGVVAYAGHENPGSSTDGYGTPAHSIWIVVEGGSATAVATAIANRKPPGIQTQGAQQVTVIDSAGVPTVINFDYFTQEPITVVVTIQPLANYAAATGTQIINAIVSFINSLGGGQTVYPGQVQAAASLVGQTVSSTFAITALTMAIGAGSQSTSPIVLTFNQIATCSASNVTLIT